MMAYNGCMEVRPLPVLGEGAGTQYDVVVYGGGFAGVAAAGGATRLRPGARVLLIAPESNFVVGGLFTAGGQNFWDVRYWGGETPQAGSFARWFAALGQFYSVEAMADLLWAELAGLGVQTLIGYDFEDYTYQGPPQRLTGLHLRNLVPADSGGWGWGDRVQRVRGTVFIDASDDGRLARLSGTVATRGRADWPAVCLQPDETGLTGTPLNQAATLMFQVTGVVPGLYGDMAFTEAADTASRTTWGAWGGKQTYASHPAVVAFNDAGGPRGYTLKPINAAQNGPDAEEWWVNGLLLFGVDARAYDRDAGTWRYPLDVRSDERSTDAAWRQARAVIGSDAFLAALRAYPGFERAQIVYDLAGFPVLGKCLYLRESLHAVRVPRPGENGLENVNYAVTAAAVLEAGAAFTGRNPDDAAYASRIGLGFYWTDINAYRFADMRTDQGYIWPVTGHARPDWPGNPDNPAFLPYEALLAPALGNLLLPGYACGTAAMAFTALRVGPNLCVLGDAAGAAAAQALADAIDPVDFTAEHIAAVQENLRRLGARLDK